MLTLLGRRRRFPAALSERSSRGQRAPLLLDAAAPGAKGSPGGRSPAEGRLATAKGGVGCASYRPAAGDGAHFFSSRAARNSGHRGSMLTSALSGTQLPCSMLTGCHQSTSA